MSLYRGYFVPNYLDPFGLDVLTVEDVEDLTFAELGGVLGLEFPYVNEGDLAVFRGNADIWFEYETYSDGNRSWYCRRFGTTLQCWDDPNEMRLDQHTLEWLGGGAVVWTEAAVLALTSGRIGGGRVRPKIRVRPIGVGVHTSRTVWLRGFFKNPKGTTCSPDDLQNLRWYLKVARDALERYRKQGYTGPGVKTQQERIKQVLEKLKACCVE